MRRSKKMWSMRVSKMLKNLIQIRQMKMNFSLGQKTTGTKSFTKYVTAILSF